jgi:hypothetical protein
MILLHLRKQRILDDLSELSARIILAIEDIDKKFVEKNILDVMKMCEKKVFTDQDL